MQKNVMICPKCGHEMNHHADKLVYINDGERLDEFHYCPYCGNCESRPAN